MQILGEVGAREAGEEQSDGAARHTAAVQLQSTFRGHSGRKRAKEKRQLPSFAMQFGARLLGYSLATFGSREKRALASELFKELHCDMVRFAEILEGSVILKIEAGHAMRSCAVQLASGVKHGTLSSILERAGLDTHFYYTIVSASSTKRERFFRVWSLRYLFRQPK